MKDILTGIAIGALLVTVITQRRGMEIERTDEQPAILETAYTPAPVKPQTPDWLRARLDQRTDPLERKPSTQTVRSTRYRDEYLTPFTSQ